MTFFYDLNKRLQQVLDTPKSEHMNLNEGAVAAEGSTGDYSAKKARAGKDIGKPGKNFEKIAKSAGERYGSKERGEKVAGAVLAKLRGKNESVEEGEHSQYAMDLNPGLKKVGTKPTLGDKVKAGVKKVANVIAPDDDTLLSKLEKSTGGRRPAKEAAPMTAKQKSFAKLAPPEDKITFADKIAGAKKEVDEMLGDVAAEAIKAAVGKKQVSGMGEATKEIPGGRRHTSEPGGYGRRDDDDAPAPTVKKGRGRPKKGSDETGDVKKWDFSAFGGGKDVKLPKHKGAVIKHKMVGEGDDADVQAAIKLLKKAGYTVEKAEEELEEKAVSKKQQKFMGMVHAAQKGEKPASKEVAKVAKEMPKKEAEKFAKTKHKGLPEKVKEVDMGQADARKSVPASKEEQEKTFSNFQTRLKKEKEDHNKVKAVGETTTSGSVATASAGAAKSGGGMQFGKGIYDSINREVETLIAESMNISTNMSNDPQGGPTNSVTITATDEDAAKLVALLKMAGLGAAAAAEEPAGDCAPDMVDENQPDWPTDTETSDDALQYSGGLNKPKADVAGDGQSTVPVTAVRTAEEDDLKRMMEMAGVTEAAKPDYVDLDKDGDREESMKKAAKDKEEKKVEESMFNLWKAFKG